MVGIFVTLGGASGGECGHLSQPEHPSAQSESAGLVRLVDIGRHGRPGSACLVRQNPICADGIGRQQKGQAAR